MSTGPPVSRQCQSPYNRQRVLVQEMGNYEPSPWQNDLTKIDTLSRKEFCDNLITITAFNHYGVDRNKSSMLKFNCFVSAAVMQKILLTATNVSVYWTKFIISLSSASNTANMSSIDSLFLCIGDTDHYNDTKAFCCDYNKLNFCRDENRNQIKKARGV